MSASTSPPCTSRLRSRGRARTILAAVCCAAALLVPSLPAGGQATVRVLSVRPTPNTIVQTGEVVVAAELDAPGDGPIGLRVDGRDVGPLPPAGLAVDLAAGGHRLELITSDGAVVHGWTVHAADVRTGSAGSDPLDVALLAAGVLDPAAMAARLPVVLVSTEAPEWGVAAAPHAAATGAVVLPTGRSAVDPRVVGAARDLAGAGGEVLVLGGPTVVEDAVPAALQAAGLDVRRIEGATPADVAATLAARDPVASVYRRGGDPLPRPVWVAPAAPLDAALQAAAVAARGGAGLLLVDGAVTDATRSVLRERSTVWLAEGLPADAADAVRAAVRPGTDVSVRSPLPPATTRAAWVADAAVDPALALLATRAGVGGAGVVVDADAARRWVRSARPSDVVAVGRIDPQHPAAWWLDDADAPVVEAVVDPAAGTVRLLAAAPIQGLDLHVEVAGRTWPGTVSVEGSVAEWTAGPLPPLPAEVEAARPTTATVRAAARVVVDGVQAHVHALDVVEVPAPTRPSPEGFVVAGGTSAVVGTGPLRTFTVEVEPATGLDVAAVAEQANRILLDPTRGWTARGERSMQRVDDPAAASVRVVVATPGTVDRFCGRVGLDTGGRLSCWDGRRAMLNLDRWQTGVSPFHTDLEVYRTYLVSHEVGHGLGYGHVGCPAAGALAPVMMQQSKGLDACVANGWPYP